MTSTSQLVGCETPRLYSTAHLHAAGTRGDDFIQWCRDVLNIELFPWQQWLARAALATDENGDYIYRRVLVVVARQNGKTVLAAALAAWWLAEDLKHETRNPLSEPRVLGVAQNLAIAEKPWKVAADWFDPRETNSKGVPALQDVTSHVFRGNGNKTIHLNSGFTYVARDGRNSRGETAARVLLDEVREQTSWDAWDAVSETIKTFRNGQIFCLTSGGKASSIVMKTLRNEALEKLNDPASRIGLFEWSAPDGCPLDDDAALLQANPSAGHVPAITTAELKDGIKGKTEASFRSETLAQTIDMELDSIFSRKALNDCVMEAPRFKKDAPRVMCATVSHDRSMAYVLGGTLLHDGRPFLGFACDPRRGTAWLDTYVARIDDERAIWLQTNGLTVEGCETVEPSAAAGGRLYDAIREQGIGLASQGLLIDLLAGSTGSIKAGGVSFNDGAALGVAAAAVLDELRQAARRPKVIRSAYRSRGLLVAGRKLS